MVGLTLARLANAFPNDTKKSFKRESGSLSPISVLDPSFEEDDNLTSESSGGQAPVLPHRFNLIDKSPLIGSMLGRFPGMILSTKPLHLTCPNPPMSPLSWRKDSIGSRSSKHLYAKPVWTVSYHHIPSYQGHGVLWVKLEFNQQAVCGVRNGSEPSTYSMIVDRVWAQMKEWFSDEVRCVCGEGWIENFGLEMDCVGRDIELKLLGELVDEAVKEDLTGRL
ncbi:hypothetical protein MLD38_026320 [Melastoma candidum]|uniref:Uncharacterized protein n=1 Tax=Melastoma candidum TaxID=119954 RepID=A0ACB9P026_9MYRT|nr:hypothetical protein MLD38_026320 [Melastoma candidum]